LNNSRGYHLLEDSTGSKEVELISTIECDSNSEVSGISMSVSFTTMAVSYIQRNHIGFCYHSSQINLISTVNSTSKNTFPTTSCANAVALHPNYSALFAIGHHTGELTIILSNEIWAHSALGDPIRYS
jgi:hypothetical protein